MQNREEAQGRFVQSFYKTLFKGELQEKAAEKDKMQ